MRRCRRDLNGTTNQWRRCLLMLSKALFLLQTTDTSGVGYGSNHSFGNGLNGFSGFDSGGAGNSGDQRRSVFLIISEVTIGFKK